MHNLKTDSYAQQQELIQLEKAIFKEANDDLTVRTEKTVEKAKQLLEVGFEYATNVKGVKLFRKCK